MKPADFGDLPSSIDELSDDELKTLARLLGKPQGAITKNYLSKALKRRSVIGDWAGKRAKLKSPEQVIKEFRRLKI